MGKGQSWYESPKGYVTSADGVTMVVFFDYKKHGWKHVCDGAFSDVFETLDAALASAERELSIEGMVSRGRCRDVRPDLRQAGNRSRPGAAPTRENARDPGAAAGAGTRFRTRGPPPQPARTPKPPEPDPMIDGKTRVQRMIEANLARVQPAWARVLELGMPPYTAERIKAAYRAAARIAHPDMPGGDAAVMAAINAAYEAAMLAVSPPVQQEIFAKPAPAAAPPAAPPRCAACGAEMRPDVRLGTGKWYCDSDQCMPF